MITLLIVSIALAAIAPIMSKRFVQTSAGSKWLYMQNGRDITRLGGNVAIGFNTNETASSKLHIKGGGIYVQEAGGNGLRIDDKATDTQIYINAASSTPIKVSRAKKVLAAMQADGTWTPDSTPKGMVAFFNLNACPDGWKTADGTNSTLDLRGRFIRGSGSYYICKWSNWSYGACDQWTSHSVGQTEEDAIRQIQGSLDLDGTIGTGGFWGAFFGNYTAPINGNDGGTVNTSAPKGEPSRIDFNSGLTIPSAAEIRPRNVSLLACQKT